MGKYAWNILGDFDIGLVTEFSSSLHNIIKMLELVWGYIIPGINLFRHEASFPDIVYMELGHGWQHHIIVFVDAITCLKSSVDLVNLWGPFY